MIQRTLVLLYAVTSYAVFIYVFNCTIMFIGNFGITPSLDTLGNGSWIPALWIDVALLTAFGLQHSIMARPAFKRMLTQLIPPAAERSTYVLASSLALGAVVAYWQPLGGVIWQVQHPTAVAAIYGLFALGWGLTFLSSFQHSHFDMFGLRQAWHYFRGQPYTELAFTEPLLYRYVRHPLYVGLMLGLWAAPTMTVTHLAFALLSTAYIFIGVRFEERDLENALPQYSDYKQEVGMFVPKFKSKPRGGEVVRVED